MNVFDLVVVFLYGAQRSVEEPGLPQFAGSTRRRLAALVELCFTYFMASEIDTGSTGAQLQCQWSGRTTQAVRKKECSVRARLKALDNRVKSGSVNSSRRLGGRTVMKEHRSERKGRRSSDTAIEYGGVRRMAIEKARTANPADRATDSALVRRQGSPH